MQGRFTVTEGRGYPLVNKNDLKDWSKNGLKGWEPVMSYPSTVKWPNMS